MTLKSVNWVHGLVGVAGHAFAFYGFLSAISFNNNGGFHVPQLQAIFPCTIDYGCLGENHPLKWLEFDRPSGSSIKTLAWNAAVVGQFGFMHSLMARGFYKQQARKLFGDDLIRTQYVIVSALQILFLIVNWTPLSTAIYEFPAAFGLMMAISMFGWNFAFAATFALDHFELFGSKSAFGLVDTTMPMHLKENWMYAYCRHPIMTGVLIGLWATHRMSVGHLLFAALCTAYIFTAVFFLEEPDLEKAFGQEYREYKERVPPLCPMPLSLIRPTPPPKTKQT